MGQIVSLSFHRFDSLRSRAWAFAMMGLARGAMARVPGIGFWKLCGSGTGEGFTPRPNLSVYAILATWPDAETARAQICGADIFARYRDRAAESWTVFLSPTSVRGKWSDRTPFAVSHDGPPPTALAALTRAAIRPAIAARFWRRVPDISSVIGADTGVLFKIGIGEVPWLHQVTFSIWPDTRAMAAFARTGPHAEAIEAVRRENWFREELYARFAIHSDIGTWNGVSPLKAAA
ncbi:spheroidene monooxygenase [Marivita sp. GX14005]|uniref:spheroidene monooxygenase n=1 Tax=Marivita sp. GX14005 TaxID=2942276 RepID=UPI0020188A05|nr:spheroidene monooxygenase [Marivita sp. GX14005]MCL3883095.1 spheroidene monooxygenase [Marivita sp. GX14005]